MVYINSDGNERGFLGASGSHTLERFVNAVAKDIKDPESGLTVWKRWQANRYRTAAEAAQSRLSRSPDIARAVNERLIQSERELTDRGGLPGRPWYRHLLYAPGTETGYGAKTMPGAREGIEQGRYAEAESELVRIAAALEREARLIDAATADLERVPK